MHHVPRAVALCSLLLTAFSTARAVLRLDPPFGDHMVLPHDVPVTLWGSGAPGGDTVRVSVAGQTAVARSDWQGRWMVRLAPLKPGGPFQMTVQVGGSGAVVPSSAANNTDGLEINDVLVGEVLPAAVLQTTLPLASKSCSFSGKDHHPFALVRVHVVGDAYRGGSWRYVSQDTVPKGLEGVFAAGCGEADQAHMPVGVLETTAIPACAPSTRCSAH